MTRALLQQSLDRFEKIDKTSGYQNNKVIITAIREYLVTEQKPICPMCALQLDEAAGVDFVGLKQQLAAVEQDYAICKHSLEQLKHDLILKNAQLADCEKERDRLKEDVEHFKYQAHDAGILRVHIASMTKERESFYMDYRMKCDFETKELHKKLAACEKERDMWKETSIYDARRIDELSAYAQQLRDTILWLIDSATGSELQKCQEALALRNDTSALDQLRAGYELQIKQLRDALRGLLSCQISSDHGDVDAEQLMKTAWSVITANQDTSALDALVKDAEVGATENIQDSKDLLIRALKGEIIDLKSRLSSTELELGDLVKVGV